jgi:hypothetical protein
MSEANGTAATVTTDNTKPNEIQTLQEKNDRLYAQLVDSKKQLDSYSKLGAPDDLRGKLEDYEGLRKTTAKTPEDVTKLLSDKEAEYERRYSSKLGELETKNQSLSAAVQKYEVVTPTMQKAAAIFRDTELDLVNMLVERDLASQDGKIIVKGTDGKALYSLKNPRDLMGVDEYLESLAVKYPGIAKAKTLGTGKEAGSTSATTGSTGSDTPPNDFATWPKENQSAWFKANPKALDRFMTNGGKF